jgi:hypothetical protein
MLKFSMRLKIFLIWNGFNAMDTHRKGNIALGKAISYFTEQGYVVNLPLNDSQWYDLVIENNGVFQTVQVKYAGEQKENGAYLCSLRTISGTSRKIAYTVKDTRVELLFCYCPNGDIYLIPTCDFNNRNSITLSRERSPCAAKQSLDTSKYILN